MQGQPPGGFIPPTSPYGPGQPAAPGGGAPLPWQPVEAFSYAWEHFKADFGTVGVPLIVASVVIAACQGVFAGIEQGVSIAFAATGEFTPEMLQFAGLGVSASLTPFKLIPQAFMTGGIVLFTLELVRGRKPDFGVIFQGGKYFVPMYLATFLQQIGIGVGMMLCFVPGIIFALGTSMFSYLIVDKKLSVVDSLKESWAMTTGHKGNLFVWTLLVICVVLVGLIACCIGSFVSGVLVTISGTYIYAKLNGEEPVPPAFP